MLPDEEKARLSPEPSDRREQLYEVSVFLFLIIPSMTLSFFVIRGQESSDFVITAVFTILRDLGLVALLLFFLWRNGEAWNLLGWAFKNGWKEIFGRRVPKDVRGNQPEHIIRTTCRNFRRASI